MVADTEGTGFKRLFALPLLSYGFRVFFLFAGIEAALAMAAWLSWIGLHAINIQVLSPSIVLAPHLWHAHEMVFGYTLAVITGFFLTAVPSWTGQRPIQGATLALLAWLWLTARLASWTSALVPAALFAFFELSFIALLGGLVARALIASWSKRNMIFLAILLALFVAAALVHLELLGLTEGSLQSGQLLAIDTILLLITIIGGRIVPAFTTNALRQRGATALPVSRKPIELAAIAAVVLLLLADLLAPGSQLVGLAALAAAIAGALRLAGWRSLQTLSQPIVWILHVGYAWLVVGFALKAIALLVGVLPEITALHALTVGAIGSMTLGVMTRAGLGHTGRPLVAPPAIVLAYLLISLAAVLRLIGPLAAPSYYNEAMLLAGCVWVAAFLLFSMTYWPILTRPRLTARPGGS